MTTKANAATASIKARIATQAHALIVLSPIFFSSEGLSSELPAPMVVLEFSKLSNFCTISDCKRGQKVYNIWKLIFDHAIFNRVHHFCPKMHIQFPSFIWAFLFLTIVENLDILLHEKAPATF